MAHRGSHSRSTPKGSSSGRQNTQGGPRAGSSSNPSGHATINCPHYNRNCNMVSPCCGKIVCCQKGHDESHACENKLNLSAVITLVCCSCKQSQPVGNGCRACSRTFGERGCTICRIWYSGDGFHCRECGVCRRGREKDMWHCATCKRCYEKRSGIGHICSVSSKNCVGCGKDTSRKPSTTMLCGHMMHCNCFLKRVEVNFSCPLRSCKKIVANMRDWNKALDLIAAAEQAQHPSSPVKIYCFECRGTSVALGNYKKCRVSNCGSYNTVRIPISQQNMPFSLPPSNMPRR